MIEEELDLFDTLETAIIEGLMSVELKGDEDLITLIAVFAKLAADAAVSYGISEHNFADTMRRTYVTMREHKKELQGERE